MILCNFFVFYKKICNDQFKTQCENIEAILKYLNNESSDQNLSLTQTINLLDENSFIKSVSFSQSTSKGKTKPNEFKLVLESKSNQQESNCPILFKAGDDLRKDMIILQSIALINQVKVKKIFVFLV